MPNPPPSSAMFRYDYLPLEAEDYKDQGRKQMQVRLLYSEGTATAEVQSWAYGGVGVGG